MLTRPGATLSTASWYCVLPLVLPPWLPLPFWPPSGSPGMAGRVGSEPSGSSPPSLPLPPCAGSLAEGPGATGAELLGVGSGSADVASSVGSALTIPTPTSAATSTAAMPRIIPPYVRFGAGTGVGAVTTGSATGSSFQ